MNRNLFLHFHSHDGNGHTHEPMEHAGQFHERDAPLNRDFHQRAFTVGIGGPVGSGKTALMLALCRKLRDRMNIAVVTNDIFTKEDGEFLIRHNALAAERIRAVETGGCPHAAIREDISANLLALEELQREFGPQMLLLESGGDNLAAHFSRELADYTIYVIDVAAAVGADLTIMERDTRKMRGPGPFVFAQLRHGPGVDEIVSHVLHAWQH